MIYSLTLEKTRFLFLYLHVRSVVSSAIRMSLVGPYKGQEILFKSQQLVSELIALVKIDDVKLAVQTCPILDILQGSHDRLYTRIFNS